jgi:hypothetical protein
MKNVPSRTVSALCLSLSVAFLCAAAARAQEELVAPTPSDQEVQPTPSDPTLQREWAQVQAARGRLSLAEDKYQEAQQALKDSPGSSEAKSASRAAKKQRDNAQKDLKKAESNWRRRVAESSRRRPPTGGAGAAAATSTPTPLPLGNDTVLPTPVDDRVPPPAPGPLESPFEGSFSGEWVNETFGTGGPASAVITVDEAGHTFQVVLTLGGRVFGEGTPAPQTLTGSFDAGGRAIRTRSELFGDVALTVSPTGAVRGTATNLPNRNIGSVDFNGNATPEKVELAYTVHFAGGGESAKGKLRLNHQPK